MIHHLILPKFAGLPKAALLTLSIIIVNYNVRYFLEQCLYSITRSHQHFAVEVIVVDNNSTDGSLDYLPPIFPQVIFIPSQTNLGFGKACNLGLSRATGAYILFLNPDTIIAEDSLGRSVHCFETHTGIGALGVKMIDGSGRFLKESKRSFPSPLTSLYKLFGLSFFFPTSKTFSRYHLGHLDNEGDHEVDVLAGAYLMTRREVLDKTGGFDEEFFMYGEDVDLSYRIQQAGYRNYYFAGTTIIHFKGESTKRGSLNYVKMFYHAMSVFVKKHYGGTKAGLFSALIHAAIWFRALVSGIGKLFRWMGLAVIDALFILFSFWLVKEIWQNYVRPDIVYSNELLYYSFPLFTLLYLVIAYYAGLYDKHYRTGNLVRSTFIATLALLALYSLLPERYRFSRGIVVFGAFLTFVLISLLRAVLVRMGWLSEPIDKISKPYILIAANEEGFTKARQFLEEKGLGEKIIGRVATHSGDAAGTVAGFENLLSTARSVNAQELVLDTRSLSYKRLINEIQNLKGRLSVKLFAERSMLGSNDQSTKGEILTQEANFNLSRPTNRRLKRLIDVIASLQALLLFPLQLLLVRSPGSFFLNALDVLLGKKTWIGYSLPEKHLPPLQPSILGPNGNPYADNNLTIESVRLIDYWYAHDYTIIQDLKLILENYRYLGNTIERAKDV